MLLTSTRFATLAVVVLAALCLGLWANTFKMAGKWRFELYYLDFSVGVLFTAVIAALTLGTLGFDGFSFTDDLLHASKKQDLLGLASGAVFNLGNLLLLGGVSLSGMSVAFPLAFGISLCLGSLWTYAAHPSGNSAVLFAGAIIVIVAGACSTFAFRFQKLYEYDELARTGKVKSTRRQVNMKGVIVSLISGVFLGTFGPLLERSQVGDSGVGAYSAAFLLAAGIFASTLFLSLFFMNLPLDGKPLDIVDYFRGTIRQHGLGWLGGILWCAGTIGILVATHAEGPAVVRLPIIFGSSQSSAVIAAVCGLLVWHEFKASEGRVRALLVVGLALFVCGLAMISVAPSWLRA